MARKTAFSRAQVVETAFTLLRDEGPEALTARKVAERMGGSTHPIYRIFSSKNELEEAVIEHARIYAVEKILDYRETDEPFLGIGMGYLAFAREEPQLFRVLFIGGRFELDFETMEYPLALLLQRMGKDPHLSGLRTDQMRRLLTDMWIYTHGLNSIADSLPAEYDRDDFLYRRLRETGGTLIGWEQLCRRMPEAVESLFPGHSGSGEEKETR
jgi:AcrR family transcriptional regulator